MIAHALMKRCNQIQCQWLSHLDGIMGLSTRIPLVTAVLSCLPMPTQACLHMLQGFFEGERELDGWLADVRDVARAHVLAAETPSAHGRYIVSNSHTVSNEQLYSILTDRFPQYKFPSKEPQEHKLLFDTSKVRAGQYHVSQCLKKLMLIYCLDL